MAEKKLSVLRLLLVFLKVGLFTKYLGVSGDYMQDIFESMSSFHYTQNVEIMFLNILTNFAIKVFEKIIDYSKYLQS
jgi:hypothetical protein